MRDFRWDMFIVWGNGLPHIVPILDMIKESGHFEVRTIKRHFLQEGMSAFIEKLYACDTVPWQHLIAKTRYLVGCPNEVYAVLVKNFHPQEKLFGEGDFRHIQCQTVKDMKELIRNAFNPRRPDGSRTEEHVVHGTDYPSQVVHSLRVLGMETLEQYMVNEHYPFVVPHHVTLGNYGAMDIVLDSIKASIVGVGPVSLRDTPHYRALQGDWEIYGDYAERYLGLQFTDGHTLRSFRRLAEDYQGSYETPDGKSTPVLLRLHGDDILVLDGVHRACVALFRCQKTISSILSVG